MRKYRNQPVIIDGIKFDSKAEGRRYGELVLREAAGDISELECHPRYAIEVQGQKVCTYVADFRYRDASGAVIVEDVKGAPPTPLFRLKAKLLLACHGIAVTIVR